MSNSLGPYELQPARFLYPCNSPGKNTGVGCHALQGNLLIQGLIWCLLHLLHWQADSLPQSHLGSHLFLYNLPILIFKKFTCIKPDWWLVHWGVIIFAYMPLRYSVEDRGHVFFFFFYFNPKNTLNCTVHDTCSIKIC